MRVQVVIVGAGPAGLLLGALLHQAGVEALIVEQRSADYVLGRIRAGVLEQGTVDLLDQLGLGARLHAEGLVHGGVELSFGGRRHRIDLHKLSGGKNVTVYGQTEITRDLMLARSRSGQRTVYDADQVSVHDFETDKPSVRWVEGGHRGSTAWPIKAAVMGGVVEWHVTGPESNTSPTDWRSPRVAFASPRGQIRLRPHGSPPCLPNRCCSRVPVDGCEPCQG